MSELAEHVTLTITANTVGIARAGFGVPMILSHSVTWTERTRSYGSLGDIAADFAAGTPEYISASQIFAQSPHPESVIVGRASLKPTQVYVIGVSSVVDSHAYSVNVSGPGITTTTATFTSGGSTDNDTIVAGLVTQLNNVIGATYTAAATGSSGSQVVTVTANASGVWFSLSLLNVAELSIKQTHADPGVATDLAAILLQDDTWYALHTTFNSKDYVLAAAAWVESNTKLYLVDVNETEAINVAVGSTPGDTLYALFQLTYNRTVGSYYSIPSSMFSAAWMGRVLPDEPGSETWKFKTLAGIVPMRLTSTQRTNLRARKANSYTTIAGVNKTWEGTVAGGDLGFIDVTRGLDWLEDDMAKSVFEALAGEEKIPYTDAGIAVIRSEVKSSLKRAAARTIIADDFEISVPKVAAISQADKALRKLPDVKFTATLQGAIHSVQILGTVSV